MEILTGLPPRRAPRPAVWAVVNIVSTAGWVMAITLVFLGMRSVMEIGGSCGSGGPYVIARPCPDGVAPLMALSIPLGILFVFLHIIAAAKLGAPMVGILAWPALFLSLGWNFWQFGLSPPGGGGPEWGWIICGVVFVLMGGLPLIGIVKSVADTWSTRDRGDPAVGVRRAWLVAYAIVAVAAMVLAVALFEAVT